MTQNTLFAKKDAENKALTERIKELQEAIGKTWDAAYKKGEYSVRYGKSKDLVSRGDYYDSTYESLPGKKEYISSILNK